MDTSQSEGVKEGQQAEGGTGGGAREWVWLMRLERLGQQSSVGQGQVLSISWVTVQFSSATQSCLTPCDPMDYSTPGLPVYHQLLEFTQTHVHLVSDAIQPAHPP